MSTKAGICPGCSGICKAAAYPRQDAGIREYDFCTVTIQEK